MPNNKKIVEMHHNTQCVGFWKDACVNNNAEQNDGVLSERREHFKSRIPTMNGTVDICVDQP